MPDYTPIQRFKSYKAVLLCSMSYYLRKEKDEPTTLINYVNTFQASIISQPFFNDVTIVETWLKAKNEANKDLEDELVPCWWEIRKAHALFHGYVLDIDASTASFVTAPTHISDYVSTASFVTAPTHISDSDLN